MLDKLFGRRRPPSSGPHTRDLRSAKEQQMEIQGRRGLHRENEKLARRLYYLLQQEDEHRSLREDARAEIVQIGQQLCANGGDDLMKKVAYRVAGLGERLRSLELYWNSIYGWM